MLYLTEDEVRQSLTVADTIEILRGAFREFAAGRGSHQPRRRLYLETGAVLHSMTGGTGKYFGTKVYSTHAKHGAWFTVLLYDAETARPLAQMEANWLGQIRTGAVTGLAADCLVPRKPLTVGCIGSGFQARSQVEAIASVRHVEAVKVWSRRQEKREAFARETNLPVRIASSADDAADCDVLITATYSKDPVVRDEAVRPGTVVFAMGSNHPQRRELPGELVRRSWVAIEDESACRVEAGDLLLADADWSTFTELKTLVANPVDVPRDRPVIFKSVGIGLEDVAAAAWLYERRTGA